MNAVGQQGHPPRLVGEVEQDRVGRGLNPRVQLGGVLRRSDWNSFTTRTGSRC